MKVQLAKWLRTVADRLDYAGAFKGTNFGFEFVEGVGAVLNQEQRGCPLWYHGDGDYAKAHHGLKPATRYLYGGTRYCPTCDKGGSGTLCALNGVWCVDPAAHQKDWPKLEARSRQAVKP